MAILPDIVVMLNPATAELILEIPPVYSCGQNFRMPKSQTNYLTYG